MDAKAQRLQYRTRHQVDDQVEFSKKRPAGGFDTIDHDNDDNTGFRSHAVQEDGTDQELFDRLKCSNESIKNLGDNDDLEQYFSQKERYHKKSRGLSFEDLAATPESDAQAVRSGSMKGSRRKTSEAVVIHTVPSVVKEFVEEEP